MRIDRLAEDDTPRASPDSDSRAADNPPTADVHETRDRATYIAEYRATVDAAYREYSASRGWDEAAPAAKLPQTEAPETAAA